MRGIIYKYTCKINNKVYIGQTIDEVKRKSAHKHMSTCWKSHFYNAISKYGYDFFDYTVIYEVISDIPGYVKQVLDLMEVYYIKKYNSTNPNQGYNIAAGGGGTVGVKCSEEHKKKISEIMKNKHIVLTDKQRKAVLENLNKKRNLDGSPKPINQYSLNGIFIEHFKSYKEASIAIGGNERAFARAMREGINKGYYKGYYWSSQKAETIPIQLLDLKTNRPRIPILQYGSNDTLIKIWKSYNEIAKAYGKNLTTIKDNITKYPNEYLGYKWVVLNNCSKQDMYQLFYGKKVC